MKTDIRQHDLTDCGVACICSVARHYGMEVPLTIVREASGTDAFGTSIKGMLDGCRAAGFDAVAYNYPSREVDRLRAVPLPAIAHVIKSGGDLHFVVLYHIGRRSVRVMDPARGRHISIKNPRFHDMWSGHIITLAPDPGLRHEFFSYRPSSCLLRCIRTFKLCGSDLAAALPGSFFTVVAGIVMSLYLKRIVDVALPSGDLRQLGILSLQMLAMTLASVTASYLSSRYLLRSANRLDAHFAKAYLRHLFSLPCGFFNRRSAGELTSRITDAMKIRSVVTQGFAGMFTGAVLLVGSLALMFGYNRALAAMTLAFVPVYLLLAMAISRVSSRRNREVVERSAELERVGIESVSCLRQMKYFGTRPPHLEAERAFDLTNFAMYRSGKAAAGFSAAVDMTSRMLSLCIVTFGGLFVCRGSLTVGGLVSFYTLAAWFSTPLADAVNMCRTVSEASLSFERLDDIMLLEEEPRGELEPSLDKARRIVFRDVDFSYPGGVEVLRGFNLVIPEGSITAIVGESGCGKSSLASLLMRDQPVSGGSIMLDMNDISLIDIDAWRRYISIVPQDAALLSGTILDNITGGEAKPDLDRVAHLVERLGLKDEVISMPLGLLTRVGERGCLLSGGQRQRVAMARALYRNPFILILDEATAALDSASQNYILETAAELRSEGRTVIMITHRKDNTEIADVICDMSHLHRERPL